MKSTLFTLLVAAIPLPLWAAPPVPAKPLDAQFLKLFVETGGFSLGRPVSPKPTPDGKAVLFLSSGPKSRKRAIYEFDVATAKTRELLSAETLLQGAEENLTPEEKARRERMRVTAGGFADFQFDESGQFLLLPLSGKLFVFDRKSEKARELKIPAGTIIDAKWSPDGKQIGYVRDYDVYVYDLATNKESAVTTGGTIVKTNGIAEFVAQEEMARFSGFWWSPDSKFIAFEEVDHTDVETWYVADPSKPDQKPLQQYYPRPGRKNVSVRLGIVPITGGKVVWVDWDRQKFEYLASVRWDKKGPLTVQLQDRKQQVISLNQVSPQSGKLTLLLEEKDAAFTNLNQTMPRWVGAGDHFLWVREATGASPALELHHADGSVFDTLLGADVGLLSVVDYDAEKGEVFYTASTDPTQVYVYRKATIKLDPELQFRPRRPDSEPKRLGEGSGMESVVFSKNKEVYVLSRTSLTSMPHFAVYTRDKKVGELPSLAEEPSFVPQTVVEKVGDFYAAITRPHGFNPKLKYPVIVDVYGGPHHLHVNQSMRGSLIPQWIADQGFIVVAIDNRGTPGRGRDWERAIYQKFGSVPIDDQVAGLKELGKKYPELDLDRVGISGWSFGGYMSALAVLKRPDVFKASVAGAPVTDWEDYDTHYTERYMGILPESKKAYEESSLLPMAANLSRPLLLVHGTADDNVYYRHTLRLSAALLKAGKDFETLALPGITHMVSADPIMYERYMTRMIRHFQTNLGQPK
jgi:dipeptidyl-peptidase-4